MKLISILSNAVHSESADMEKEMAKRFTRRHTANGYSAMGGSLRRPIYKGMNSKRSVAEAIVAERAAAARAAKIKRK